MNRADDLLHLLEVLYRSHDAWETLVAEYHEWAEPRPNARVVVQSGASGAKHLRWGDGGPWETRAEATRRIWSRRPDRLRVEVYDRDRLVKLGVRSSHEWWLWSHGRATMSGAADGTGRALVPALLDPPLLSPTRLLEWMRLEPLGRRAHNGYKALCARGWPRNPLPTRGDRHFDLEFDEEHGTLLRRANFEGDHCFQVTEAVAVTYGAEVAPDRFAFVMPDDVSEERTKRRARVARGVASGRAAPATGSIGNRVLKPGVGCGHTLWLTGLSGSGKSTLALATRDLLMGSGRAAVVVDEEMLGQGLSSDLGLSRSDRAEQARRTAHAAALIASSGVVAIVAMITPFAQDRERARQIHEANGLSFCEVWLDTPVAVCEARDPHGVYARSRAGRVADVSGLDGRYEVPEAPWLQITGAGEHPDRTAARIVRLLLDHSDPWLRQNAVS